MIKNKRAQDEIMRAAAILWVLGVFALVGAGYLAFSLAKLLWSVLWMN